MEGIIGKDRIITEKVMKYVCKKCGHIFKDKEHSQSCGCSNESFIDYMGCGLYNMSAVNPTLIVFMDILGEDYLKILGYKKRC